MSLLVLDNTKKSTFETCPRKYYFSFIRNLQSNIGSAAIRYGVCFHEGADVLYRHIKEIGYNNKAMQEGFPAAIEAIKKKWEQESVGLEFYEDYRSLPNLIFCFTQFVEKFKYDYQFITVLETERTFNVHITMRQDIYPGVPNFIFAGKIDGEIEHSSLRWNLEYKTTSQPLHLQKSRLNRSPQFIGYQYAARQEGHDVVGTMVVFHYIRANSLKAGGYGKLSCEFERVPQLFSDEDLEAWKDGLCETAYRIMRSIDLNHFPMQHSSCYQYGQCTFYRLCEQNRPLGEENTDGYHEKLIHWDEEITKDGRKS